MNDTNIRQIQAEAIKSMETLAGLVTEITATLSNKKRSEYALLKNALEHEIIKIQKLELTAAVVAPMKSGKSTIINAITGQELLPTRNAAMTTLPTKVSLRADLASARLLLSDQIIDACHDLIVSIIEKIRKTPQEEHKVTDRAPHLSATLHDILSGNTVTKIVEETEGSEQIVNTLMLLNEIIRISSYLDIPVDKLNNLTELPRVESPYLKDLIGNRMFGELVFIDTPGPNEAGQEQLGDIVREQLQQCSVVMVVLDYTGLNAKAADEIKQEVEKIIELRGRENLFVLVNKVDARNGEHDMSTSDVMKYAQKLFGFTDDDHYTERIFEISARRAFAASRCLFGSDKRKPDSASVQNLLKIRDPFGWEEKVNNISEEELQEQISIIWKSSNFSPFLEKAVTKLLANAAPMAIRSAMNQGFGIIAKIADDAALRKSGIDTEIENIRSELKALTEDLARVLKKRNELHGAENIKTKLESELLQITKRVRTTLPDSIKRQFKKEKNLTFVSEQEAATFITGAQSTATEEIRKLMTKYQQEIRTILLDEQKEITAVLTENVQPIIEQVKQRIEKTFNVEITFREPGVSDLQLGAQDLEMITSNKKTHTWTEKVPRYTTRYIEIGGLRRWLNNNLGTDLFVETVEALDGYDDIQKESVHYEVSLSDLENGYTHAIQTNLRSAEDMSMAYVNDHIYGQVKVFFDSVDDQLGRYKNSLSQMEQDHLLGEEEKKKLRQQLNAILERAQIEKGKLRETEKQLRENVPKDLTKHT